MNEHHQHPSERTLFAFLDRDEEHGARSAVERHLQDCTRCRARADTMAAFHTRLDVQPDQSPSRDLWPGLERRIRAHRLHPADAAPRPTPARRPTSWTWWRRRPAWGLALAAGTLALVAAIGGGLLRLVDNLAPVPPTVPSSLASRLATSSVRDDAAVALYLTIGSALRDQLEAQPRASVVATELSAEVATFDAAIIDILDALAHTPDDQDLRSYLLETLHAQVRLLERVERSLSTLRS